MAPTPRRRLGAAALAALLGAAGLAGLASQASATAAFTLTRVAGTDRYATASAVAANAFPTGAQTAVIARGDAFADALAGAYLAGLQTGGAPVLLTTTGTVPDATKTRLAAMGVKNVILLGGTAAISTAAEQDLAKTYTVTRVAGANRYDTAAKVAQTPSALGVGTLGGLKTAIVASGDVFPDALAAGPVGYSQRFPIILTRAGTLPAESKAALTALAIKHVVLVGGTSAISDAVDAEVKAAGATTERVAGANRYATATALADFAIAKLPAWSTTTVDLATGEQFADALAGGPAAGRGNRSIVLTASTALSAPTQTWLQAHAATLTSGRVFGGTSAVSDAAKAAAQAAGGASATSSSGQVTEADTNNDRYTFVASGATTATTVTYKATDLFTVDGKPADISGFEANASPADTITYTAGTSARHDLVNVDASKITSGLVGNVDTSLVGKKFSYIDRVTGDTLRAGIVYSGTGATYKIDGAPNKTVTQFEADISEGDSITITGAEFALTNADVTGPANDINKQLPVQAQLHIGALGDDPASNADDLYVANSQDAFVIPGTTATDFATFNDHLTTGDTVTYKRVGSTETYTLVDQAPATQTGQAMGTVTKDGDGVPANDTGDGGNFKLATATGEPTITYGKTGQFLLNGVVSSEGAIEAAYSPGDTITFRAADDPSGTAQQLALTDANLAGAVKASTIDTSENPPNANTYEVLAQNGTSVLAKVSYADGADLYKVNGVDKTLAEFEAELTAIKGGTKTGTVVVTTSGTNQVHSLTTTAAS
ncbi:MAG: Alkaline phosphatase [Actinomycetia bacterium]|nr:Alkaline phosphatase [Actinomycetes bacterium]